MSELTRESLALTPAIRALKMRVAIPTKRVGKTAISVAVGPSIPMPHDDAFGTSVAKKSAPVRMSVTIKKGDHPRNWRPKGIRKMTYAARGDSAGFLLAGSILSTADEADLWKDYEEPSVLISLST